MQFDRVGYATSDICVGVGKIRLNIQDCKILACECKTIFALGMKSCIILKYTIFSGYINRSVVYFDMLIKR